MIRIAAVYPRQEQGKFDMEYYVHVHLPMVLDLIFSVGIKEGEVQVEVSKRRRASESPFLPLVYLYFDSLADFQSIA